MFRPKEMIYLMLRQQAYHLCHPCLKDSYTLVKDTIMTVSSLPNKHWLKAAEPLVLRRAITYY